MGLSEEQRAALGPNYSQEEISMAQLNLDRLRNNLLQAQLAETQRINLLLEQNNRLLMQMLRRMEQGVAVVNAYDEEGQKQLLWIGDEFAP